MKLPVLVALFLLGLLLVPCEASRQRPHSVKVSSREKTTAFVLPLYPEAYTSRSLPNLIEGVRTHTEFYTRMGGGHPLFVVYPSSHVPPEHIVSTLMRAVVREHVYLVAFDDPSAQLFDFLAGGFLTVPELQHLEWLWLLFPGVKYVCPFIFDPFVFLTRLPELRYVWSTAVEHRLPRGVDDRQSLFLQAAMQASHWNAPPHLLALDEGFRLPSGFLIDPSFEFLHFPTFRDGGYLDFYRRARPAAPGVISLQDLCIIRTAGVALFLRNTQVHQLGTLTGHTTLKPRLCYQSCSSTHPDCTASFDRQQLFDTLGEAPLQVLNVPPFAALPLDIAPLSSSNGFSVDDDTFTVLLVGWFLLMSVCLLVVFFLCLACYSTRTDRRSGPLPSRVRRPQLSRGVARAHFTTS